MPIFNNVYMGKAKYTCLQKPAFVVRTVEGTVDLRV